MKAIEKDMNILNGNSTLLYPGGMHYDGFEQCPKNVCEGHVPRVSGHSVHVTSLACDITVCNDEQCYSMIPSPFPLLCLA